MTLPSVIVVQSESWLDRAKTERLRFRTGLHLFSGKDDGETAGHDRVIIWRHASTCPNRATLTTQPLWQTDGAEQWACGACHAEPIVYRRQRPSWLTQISIFLLARAGIRVGV